jgi:protein-disulfide isomerase
VKFTRRETLTLAAAATAVGVAGLPSIADAKDGDVVDQLKLMAPAGIPDKIMGDPNAKVTVIEYASPTCPHCAIFSNTVLQAFQDKYVKTGKVKFILRPFARNTMDAAIFMLAEAASQSAAPAAAAAPDASSEASAAPVAAATPDTSAAAATSYENVLSAYFRTQGTWGTSDKPLDAVKAVATQLGFSDASFDTALKNQPYFDAVQKLRDQAVNDFGLEGTPTFYINGKSMSGEKSLDELSAAIDPLL